ncbi:hypothetical protein [Nonomuraea insulae]|uniref:Uncharacterized protein n=1 Tax=Nonomuraea insulae TaxID=1616787 RepID=A0ABW1CS57_9ACTN
MRVELFGIGGTNDSSEILDDPARASLLGAHAHLAERRGRVLRYPLDVAPFLSMPPDPGPADWDDVAALVGPGGHVSLPGLAAAAPAGWTEISAACAVPRPSAPYGSRRRPPRHGDGTRWNA